MWIHGHREAQLIIDQVSVISVVSTLSEHDNMTMDYGLVVSRTSQNQSPCTSTTKSRCTEFWQSTFVLEVITSGNIMSTPWKCSGRFSHWQPTLAKSPYLLKMSDPKPAW